MDIDAVFADKDGKAIEIKASEPEYMADSIWQLGGGCFMDMNQYCDECGFMKRYNYGKRIYYCDHEGRIDDMGKLSVDELPRKTPAWCPLRRATYTVGKIHWIEPDTASTYPDYINNPCNVNKSMIGLGEVAK